MKKIATIPTKANIFIFIQCKTQINSDCVFPKYFRNFNVTELISESLWILILRNTGTFKAHHNFRPH